MTYREAMDAASRALVERVLREHHGSRVATARDLGLSRQGLWKLLRRHGIRMPSQAPQAIGWRRAVARRAMASQ